MKFPRERRMTSSGEFRKVRELGRSAAGAHLVMAVLETGGSEPFKAGFITSKRVGGAVLRNRVRRRLRAIVREAGENGAGGRHVVMIARARAGRATYAKLKAEWCWLARKLGVLPKSSKPRKLEGNRGGA